MEPLQILQVLVSTLEKLGVPSMLVGSFASSFHGFPRLTQDALLSKLHWYRQGGEVSENQWRDVIGILKIQAGRLDLAYLQKWAEELGISDLMLRARHEAGG